MSSIRKIVIAASVANCKQEDIASKPTSVKIQLRLRSGICKLKQMGRTVSNKQIVEHEMLKHNAEILHTWMILTLLMAGSITPASMLFLTTPFTKSKPVLYRK